MTCILGIDPGQTGAVGFFFLEAGRVTVEDMPIAGDRVNGTLLKNRIWQLRPDVAIIENVASMPKQGVASTFKFGLAYGTAIGVVQGLDIPLHFVTPGRWKKHFRLSSDKEEARRRALELFPHAADELALKKHHGRAEAALIALFGAQTIPNIGSATPETGGGVADGVGGEFAGAVINSSSPRAGASGL
ncbi:hypothetical protein [Chelatococcus reniformis]|uniref:Uncharacterized protein n=1 Tax=Chelatococcus reniformis TaxID=1494448 RepID=A0A916UC92_9HYPH|nr:hypothetical protein [Chelatococcus reniformis]GGC68387.1 hypothetical protein GCM10010994_28690 [Chelatococcus reniformis]